MEITDSGFRRLCAEMLAGAGKEARSGDVAWRAREREWLMTCGRNLADQMGFSVDVVGWVAKLPLDKPDEA